MPNLNILFEDQYLLAVNKPAGLLVYEPQVNVEKKEERGETSLVELLTPKLNFQKPDERSGIVHRLDKDTSGILLVAKNEESEEVLKSLFKERKIIKKYTALVAGIVEPKKGIINIPLARGPKERLKIVPGYGGKESITEYEVEKYYQKAKMTLLSVNLKTGRTHQIRVHFAAIGHPVIGDQKYSNRTTKLKRQFLHATSLEFEHPFTRERLKISSNLPPDLLDFLSDLS